MWLTGLWAGYPAGMSDNPYAQPQDFAGEAQYLEPKTSILAVFAFVVSIVGLIACCIPGVGPLGLLLGVVALVLISSSGGRKKGGGLAIAAIIIGLIAGLINIAVLWGMAAAGREWTETSIVIVDIENRDLTAVQGHLVSAAAQDLTQSQLDAFADSINADYGAQLARPEGMLDAIALMMEVGQRMQNAQNDVQGEYPSSTHGMMPIPLRYDQGPVLFVLIFPTNATAGGLSFNNVGFYDSTGAIRWLLPPPSVATATPTLPPAGGDADGDAGEDPGGEPGGG